MKKKFDTWNIQKKSIDAVQHKLFFHEREIWFTRIGENVGFEQSGKGDSFLRPLLIFKKFSRNVFLGIPLTSKEKTGKFYVSFVIKEKSSTAILSQIRLFDTKRLDYKYGRLSRHEFHNVKEKLIELIQ